MTQENVKSQGNVYNKNTDINANTTLDLYDTGRQLNVSGAAALTVTLPPVADVSAGWSTLVLFSSNHSHVLQINGDDSGILYGMMRSAMSADAAAGDDSVTITANPMGSNVIGSTIEVFCDGSLWHIRGETPNGVTIA